MVIDDREKISHALRRFGFGATPEMVELGLKAGLDATLSYLIEYEKVDEEFHVNPWQFCFEEGKTDVYLDPYRQSSWWGLRMVMSKRPLQEKLTLFWHNHFAVSGEKVEIGPAFVPYIETMRTLGMGKFEKLLQAVAVEPAMLFYLDGMQNQKGHPNENFAREVMELFTLGIGHYSEKDVQEAARALTGWGLRFVFYESGGDQIQTVARQCIETNRPMVAASFSPVLHDDGEKTILGETKAFRAEDLLSKLAGRPETASYLCKKLWSFFAYPEPETAIVERLAKVYAESDQNIRAVIWAIARSPEFWSEKCVRQQVKSPVEFLVSLTKQLGFAEYLGTLQPKNPKPTDPIPKPLRDVAGMVMYLGLKQGMTLLFPPDVSGWKWGQAWISTDSMVQRRSLAPLLMGIGGTDHGGAGALVGRIAAQGVPKDDEALVASFMKVFDANLPASKQAMLLSEAKKGGGISKLKSADEAAPMLAGMLNLLFSSPEFQFC